MVFNWYYILEQFVLNYSVSIDGGWLFEVLQRLDWTHGKRV